MASKDMKVVVKVDVPDDKGKQKALMVVSTVPGIDSVSMDMKDRKMTIIGQVDPVKVLEKLRKHWHADFVTVGPKEEPKKAEAKKEEPKKEEPKKETAEQIAKIIELYKRYDPHTTTQYNVYSREEDPNACVIC